MTVNIIKFKTKYHFNYWSVAESITLEKKIWGTVCLTIERSFHIASVTSSKVRKGVKLDEVQKSFQL